jgi:hypothetical protein
MRVKDLIEKLERLDLEGEIRFRGLIESGRSVSYIEVDECDIKEEGDGDKIVVLEVSGWEDGDF